MLRKVYSIFLLSILLAACGQGAQNTLGLSWLGWLICLLLLAFVFWLVLREPRAEVVEAVMTPKEDDLKLIEGIGPKIETILKAEGILTFSQLADMDAVNIKELLLQGGIRLVVTDSWPAQARLAAQGEMEKLKAYQDELMGGREAA